MRAQHRFTLAALFTVAVAIAGGGLTTAAAESEATAPPQVFNVTIDGNVDEFNGSFFAFYPNQVQAHPGDTIVFTMIVAASRITRITSQRTRRSRKRRGGASRTV